MPKEARRHNRRDSKLRAISAHRHLITEKANVGYQARLHACANVNGKPFELPGAKSTDLQRKAFNDQRRSSAVLNHLSPSMDSLAVNMRGPWTLTAL